MISYIALDLETTGLNPKLDKIIEVGAVKVVNGEIIDVFSSYVNPGRKLDERIRSLTGISEEDLFNAPTSKEVIPQLIGFCEDLPLVGHRILFDYSFVKHEAVNLGLEFNKTGIDTLKISRACFPELPSKRLCDMCTHYGIELKAHRALNDATAASDLLQKLWTDFKERYPESFSPEPLVFKVKKESPARPSQIERIKDLLERNKVECPYNIEMMTRNEASRYYDILCAKYGK